MFKPVSLEGRQAFFVWYGEGFDKRRRKIQKGVATQWQILSQGSSSHSQTQLPTFKIFRRLDRLGLYREDLDEGVIKGLGEKEFSDAINAPDDLQNVVSGESWTKFVEYVFENPLQIENGNLKVKDVRKLRVEYIEEGTVLGFCESTRENESAAEAWIFVEPSHRRKGLAKLLANSWAYEVKKRGKTAFYSHLANNIVRLLQLTN